MCVLQQQEALLHMDYISFTSKDSCLRLLSTLALSLGFRHDRGSVSRRKSCMCLVDTLSNSYSLEEAFGVCTLPVIVKSVHNTTTKKISPGGASRIGVS